MEKAGNMAEAVTSAHHSSTSATRGGHGADQKSTGRAKTVNGVKEGKQAEEAGEEAPSSRTMYLVRNMLGHLTTQAYALRDSHLQAFAAWANSFQQPVSNFAKKLVSPPLLNATETTSESQDNGKYDDLDYFARYYEIQGPFVEDEQEDDVETSTTTENGRQHRRSRSQRSNNQGSYRSFITISSTASESSHAVSEFASSRRIKRRAARSRSRAEHRFTVQLPGLEFDPLILSNRSSGSSSNDSTASGSAERSSTTSTVYRSASSADVSKKTTANADPSSHSRTETVQSPEVSQTHQAQAATYPTSAIPNAQHELQGEEYRSRSLPISNGAPLNDTSVASTMQIGRSHSTIVTSLGQRLSLVSILPPPSEEQIEQARQGQASMEGVRADLDSILDQFTTTLSSGEFARRCRPVSTDNLESAAIDSSVPDRNGMQNKHQATNGHPTPR
eukprot:gb/GECG01005563.1/.p1 GENE.gb/GECG01005563.1/~~gb/GECG01005563.1/.p1  ORF type:complete len:447 (+),score=55.70 gb/GECG01005563.1/:1-1341(+)